MAELHFERIPVQGDGFWPYGPTRKCCMAVLLPLRWINIIFLAHLSLFDVEIAILTTKRKCKNSIFDMPASDTSQQPRHGIVLQCSDAKTQKTIVLHGIKTIHVL